MINNPPAIWLFWIEATIQSSITFAPTALARQEGLKQVTVLYWRLFSCRTRTLLSRYGIDRDLKDYLNRDLVALRIAPLTPSTVDDSWAAMEAIILSPSLEVELFKHESLDLSRPTIRMVQILPGRRRNIISCKLWQVDLTRNHTCLSYTCGDDTGQQTILVNDKSYRVRRNLHNFLLEARRLEIFEPLGIDALCIDQSNIGEKNHQVHQMATIYENAKRVIAYPGKLSLRVANAVRWVNKMRRNIESQENKLSILAGYGHIICGPQRSLRLLQLAKCSYWSRVWIVQEVYLGRNVELLIGGKFLRWAEVAECFQLVNHFHTTGLAEDLRACSAGIQSLARMAGWYSLEEDGDVFMLKDFEILNKFGSHQCTDIRDRIYGLMGVSDRFDDIEVHYDEPKSTMVLRVAVYMSDKYSQHLHDNVKALAAVLQVSWMYICGTCFRSWPPTSQAVYLDESSVRSIDNDADVILAIPPDRNDRNFVVDDQYRTSAKRCDNQCTLCLTEIPMAGRCTIKAEFNRALLLHLDSRSPSSDRSLNEVWIKLD